MTRKNLPMSALITGLLAVPALGLSAPPAGAAPGTDPSPQTLVSTEFPSEMPAEIGILMRRLARGQTPDANGMAGLQRRLALDMRRKLSKIDPPTT